MRAVESADGTEIGFEVHGTGPPVVLVHGSASDRESWAGVVRELADDYRLIVPDRRGRGASGDAEEYGLDREVADLRAVVASLEDSPVVFGHSFGALVAVDAAPDLDLSALVLYEPPILVGEHRGSDLAPSMEAALDAGDRRGALREFLEVAGGVPDVDQLPWWPDRANFDLVETIIRESYAVEAYELPDELRLTVPTLLLTGEYGPEHLDAAIEALARELPESTLVELEGVGHVGTQTAPEAVGTAVRAFLEDSV